MLKDPTDAEVPEPDEVEEDDELGMSERVLPAKAVIGRDEGPPPAPKMETITVQKAREAGLVQLTTSSKALVAVKVPGGKQGFLEWCLEQAGKIGEKGRKAAVVRDANDRYSLWGGKREKSPTLTFAWIAGADDVPEEPDPIVEALDEPKRKKIRKGKNISQEERKAIEDGLTQATEPGEPDGKITTVKGTVTFLRWCKREAARIKKTAGRETRIVTHLDGKCSLWVGRPKDERKVKRIWRTPAWLKPHVRHVLAQLSGTPLEHLMVISDPVKGLQTKELTAYAAKMIVGVLERLHKAGRLR